MNDIYPRLVRSEDGTGIVEIIAEKRVVATLTAKQMHQFLLKGVSILGLFVPFSDDEKVRAVGTPSVKG